MVKNWSLAYRQRARSVRFSTLILVGRKARVTATLRELRGGAGSRFRVCVGEQGWFVQARRIGLPGERVVVRPSPCAAKSSRFGR